MADGVGGEGKETKKKYRCQKNAQGFPDRDAFRKQHLDLLNTKIIHGGIIQAMNTASNGQQHALQQIMYGGVTCTEICKGIAYATDPLLWECKVPWIYETVKAMLEEEVMRGNVRRGSTINRYAVDCPIDMLEQ